MKKESIMATVAKVMGLHHVNLPSLSSVPRVPTGQSGSRTPRSKRSRADNMRIELAEDKRYRKRALRHFSHAWADCNNPLITVDQFEKRHGNPSKSIAVAAEESQWLMDNLAEITLAYARLCRTPELNVTGAH